MVKWGESSLLSSVLESLRACLFCHSAFHSHCEEASSHKESTRAATAGAVQTWQAKKGEVPLISLSGLSSASGVTAYVHLYEQGQHDGRCSVTAWTPYSV